MRIGLFTDTYIPEINGVVSSIVTLKDQLEKNGHEVFIITNHKGYFKAKQEGNVLSLPGLELKWLYGYKLSTPYHLTAREEVKKMNLDIIHVHTDFGVGIFARLVARSLGIPLVSTYHTMYEDYTHYINKFNLNEFDKIAKKATAYLSKLVNLGCQYIIAPSNKTKEALQRYKVNTDIAVIPTGLDLDMFNYDNRNEAELDKIRNQYGISKEDFVIVYLGRIAPEKSIDFVIECFSKVKQPNAKLMIVGGGPQLDELKQLAKKLDIDNKVIFTDKKTREEVPNYYFISDAFVSASLTETQGMTFIEALASGLPIYVRPDDVLEELVDEGNNGYYFTNAEEFNEKISKYINLNIEEKEEFKFKAIKSINSYDAKNFYKSIINVYNYSIDNYTNLFEVTKIKPNEEYVTLYIENDSLADDIKLKISIDDYYFYHIRKDCKLDGSLVQELQEKSKLLKAKRAAIKKIRSKERSEREIRDHLSLYYTELSEEEVESVINDLKEAGYINDYLYVLSAVEDMTYSMNGKAKVMSKLLSKGIDYDLANSVLSNINVEIEVDLAMSLAVNLVNNMSKLSESKKISSLKSKLYTHGYTSEIIEEVISKIDFNQCESFEEEILKDFINMQYNRYSTKYRGKSLNNKIFKSCLNKGYTFEEVNTSIKKMEWYNEE